MRRRGRGRTAALPHAQAFLLYHRRLLSDAIRNRAFYRALKRHVTPDSAVLDVGAGSGVWAVASARLGARKVVAVERNPLLLAVIEQLARENGVLDRVEIVRGDSRRVRLANKFDVIVSETIGNWGLEEEIVSIMASARDRFLKPKGVVIPRRVSMMAAPGRFRRFRDVVAGTPLHCRGLATLAFNVPGFLPDEHFELLARPACLFSVDLSVVTPRHARLGGLKARWRIKNARRLTGFILWIEAELAAGIRIRTLRGTSWAPIVLHAEPFQRQHGELELELNLFNRSYWRVALHGSRGREAQAFSPTFADSWLAAHAGTGGAALPRWMMPGGPGQDFADLAPSPLVSFKAFR